MLPKQNRLKRKKDFEKVLDEGKGYIEDFLFLKIKKNDLKSSRFGFIVSQKISKKASFRNKLKRRLRELVRLKLSKIKAGFDVVLIAKTGLETKDFWEIEEILNRLFEKARILKI